MLTMRCTEWRPRDASWQFGSHGGAAIGELIIRPLRALTEHHHPTDKDTMNSTPFSCLVDGVISFVLGTLAKYRVFPFHGDRAIPSGGREIPADAVVCSRVARKFSAGRRKLRARRPRSPKSTASFRLRFIR